MFLLAKSQLRTGPQATSSTREERIPLQPLAHVDGNLHGALVPRPALAAWSCTRREAKEAKEREVVILKTWRKTQLGVYL